MDRILFRHNSHSSIVQRICRARNVSHRHFHATGASKLIDALMTQPTIVETIF